LHIALSFNVAYFSSKGMWTTFLFAAVVSSDTSNSMRSFSFIHLAALKSPLHLAQFRPAHHSQVHGSKTWKSDLLGGCY